MPRHKSVRISKHAKNKQCPPPLGSLATKLSPFGSARNPNQYEIYTNTFSPSEEAEESTYYDTVPHRHSHKLEAPIDNPAPT